MDLHPNLLRYVRKGECIVQIKKNSNPIDCSTYFIYLDIMHTNIKLDRIFIVPLQANWQRIIQGHFLYRCSDEKKPRVQPYLFSNEKVQKLGLSFTPLKKCLYDTIVSLQDKGFVKR